MDLQSFEYAVIFGSLSVQIFVLMYKADKSGCTT